MLELSLGNPPKKFILPPTAASDNEPSCAPRAGAATMMTSAPLPSLSSLMADSHHHCRINNPSHPIFGLVPHGMGWFH
jgi:hypothetical protein